MRYDRVAVPRRLPLVDVVDALTRAERKLHGRQEAPPPGGPAGCREPRSRRSSEELAAVLGEMPRKLTKLLFAAGGDRCVLVEVMT